MCTAALSVFVNVSLSWGQLRALRVGVNSGCSVLVYSSVILCFVGCLTWESSSAEGPDVNNCFALDSLELKGVLCPELKGLSGLSELKGSFEFQALPAMEEKQLLGCREVTPEGHSTKVDPSPSTRPRSTLLSHTVHCGQKCGRRVGSSDAFVPSKS